MRLSTKAASGAAAVALFLGLSGGSAQGADRTYERANPNWEPQYPHAEERRQRPGRSWRSGEARWHRFAQDWSPEDWGIAGGYVDSVEELWEMFNAPGGWDNDAFVEYLLSIGEDWWVGTGFVPGPNYAVSGMGGYDWLHPGGSLLFRRNGEWVEAPDAIKGPPIEFLGASGSSYFGWDENHFGSRNGDNDRRNRRRDRDRDRGSADGDQASDEASIGAPDPDAEDGVVVGSP